MPSVVPTPSAPRDSDKLARKLADTCQRLGYTVKDSSGKTLDVTSKGERPNLHTQFTLYYEDPAQSGESRRWGGLRPPKKLPPVCLGTIWLQRLRHDATIRRVVFDVVDRRNARQVARLRAVLEAECAVTMVVKYLQDFDAERPRREDLSWLRGA